MAELGSINGVMKRPCHFKKKKKKGVEEEKTDGGKSFFYFLVENKFPTCRLKKIKRNPSVFDV